MAVSLPLDEMSVEEKIRAMESLWDDLCRRADRIVSPSWHGDILAERDDAVQGGEDHFDDWDIAKRRIEDALP